MHSKMLFKHYKIEICSTIVLLDSHPKLKKDYPQIQASMEMLFSYIEFPDILNVDVTLGKIQL
jgi:hypothetical protein